MTPFFFGSAEHRLFGIYKPPSGRAARVSRAVMICAPWGQEYLCAHRALRRLGDLISAAGHHVMRFDYFGTGDSAGDLRESSLEDWRSDIALALEELREASGIDRASLIGLRLGASLAADVAARPEALADAVMLWDPIVSGQDYVASLQQIASGAEVDGFELSAPMAAEMRAIDLRRVLAELPARTAVVTTTEDATLDWDETGTSWRHIADVCPWQQDRQLGAGAIPVRTLGHIVEWLR